MAATAPLSEDADPASRADELRHLIEEANYNYHVLDNPTISDSEYDALMRALREIEERYPEVRTEDSPTQRVGGRVGQGFRPRVHQVPMLSLANAFSHEELDRWLAQVRRLVPEATVDFVVEPKIDGLAIALTYQQGAFRVGATRGNGIDGEDVPANLRTARPGRTTSARSASATTPASGHAPPCSPARSSGRTPMWRPAPASSAR